MSRRPFPTRTRPRAFLPPRHPLPALLGTLLCLTLASPAHAQYMAITTDNPADSLQLNVSGTSILTIRLDTVHDRDGSPQSCNSHTSARGCGTATSQALDLFSYTITLTASGGTVTWGTFQAADPSYTPAGADLADDHQTEFSRAGANTPPGRTTLGTITVTVTSGTPRIDIARGAQPLDPSGFGTGFGTNCDGNDFPNTYVLGNLAQACATGDWFDADGVPRVPAPPPDSAPTLSPIADMTVREGLTADQAISGSDPDGDALTFSKVAGPSFMTVGTASPTTGNVHLATQFLDAGGFATARASDGFLSDDRQFAILVCQPCSRGPMLAPIADVTVNEGATANQTITATDPEGVPISFTKMSGPSFMTVTTTIPNAPTVAGVISLAPHGMDSGVYAAKISAGYADIRSSWAFTITVNNVDHPPTIQPSGPIVVPEGSDVTINLVATDQDGDPVCLALPGSLPPFATAPLSACGTPTATMPIHLTPGYSDAGIYPFHVSMSSTVYMTLVIGSIQVTNVDRVPTLGSIPDMTVHAGSTADQSVSGSDPDGDAITFTKSSGPSFMTVATTSPSTGNVHLAPGMGDSGSYAATVRASDGIVKIGSSQAFTITVTAVLNRCPVAYAGGPYTGLVPGGVTFDGRGSSDPDGDPLRYAWDFDASDGIGVDAVGAIAGHVFTSAGTFVVTLTVTDDGHGDPGQVCSNSTTTTATITSDCPATVFNGYDTIRLGSSRPTWFAYVQSVPGCFSNEDVILSSFSMEYGGASIPADASKIALNSDRNGDGIQEIQVSFSKSNLRSLFAALPNGRTRVGVTVKAHTVVGRTLVGTTQVDVLNDGAFALAEVAPNPLNPQATLTYTIQRRGFVRIDMFDIQGRLVRRLVDAVSVTAGTHDVTIDGRAEQGGRLPSGVYYIRGVSPEGEFERLVTILK